MDSPLTPELARLADDFEAQYGEMGSTLSGCPAAAERRTLDADILVLTYEPEPRDRENIEEFLDARGFAWTHIVDTPHDL